jgi:hypothetical protein
MNTNTACPKCRRIRLMAVQYNTVDRLDRIRCRSGHVVGGLA